LAEGGCQLAGRWWEVNPAQVAAQRGVAGRRGVKTRRDEVDRLNTACQHVLAKNGHLGAERLQVEDRRVAVGDRVVCGHNAIGQLGVANGTRGTVTAIDSRARTLTLRLEGPEGREVTLPRWYLDGRGRGERNRRVDLAYATTGHRAQGLTRWRALVRLTGREDANWLTVQLSRAKQETRLYATVGPQPQGPAELDLPDAQAPDVYEQLAAPCCARVASGWRSTPPAPQSCGGCPPARSAPNATGSAPSSTRPPRIVPGSLSGRPPAGSRPNGT
jgi:hypothetical protein